jgi:hypothetical protein
VPAALSQAVRRLPAGTLTSLSFTKLPNKWDYNDGMVSHKLHDSAQTGRPQCTSSDGSSQMSAAQPRRSTAGGQAGPHSRAFCQRHFLQFLLHPCLPEQRTGVTQPTWQAHDTAYCLDAVTYWVSCLEWVRTMHTRVVTGSACAEVHQHLDLYCTITCCTALQFPEVPPPYSSPGATGSSSAGTGPEGGVPVATAVKELQAVLRKAGKFKGRHHCNWLAV